MSPVQIHTVLRPIDDEICLIKSTHEANSTVPQIVITFGQPLRPGECRHVSSLFGRAVHIGEKRDARSAAGARRLRTTRRDADETSSASRQLRMLGIPRPPSASLRP